MFIGIEKDKGIVYEGGDKVLIKRTKHECGLAI